MRLRNETGAWQLRENGVQPVTCPSPCHQAICQRSESAESSKWLIMRPNRERTPRHERRQGCRAQGPQHNIAYRHSSPSRLGAGKLLSTSHDKWGAGQGANDCGVEVGTALIVTMTLATTCAGHGLGLVVIIGCPSTIQQQSRQQMWCLLLLSPQSRAGMGGGGLWPTALRLGRQCLEGHVLRCSHGAMLGHTVWRALYICWSPQVKQEVRPSHLDRPRGLGVSQHIHGMGKLW
jgi:hypothetical protein